jgi:hypothetical protein
VDSEIRNGRDYVRVVIVATVDAAADLDRAARFTTDVVRGPVDQL